jgi:hypothetical protein
VFGLSGQFSGHPSDVKPHVAETSSTVSVGDSAEASGISESGSAAAKRRVTLVADAGTAHRPIQRAVEELNHHPDWSFYGLDFPGNAKLLEGRNRVIARDPRTQLLVLHVGNFAEDLDNVSENLHRCPNMTVDIAARIRELGRQPRRSRHFADRYQDRILFGTEATPHGNEFPQQGIQRQVVRNLLPISPD